MPAILEHTAHVISDTSTQHAEADANQGERASSLDGTNDYFHVVVLAQPDAVARLGWSPRVVQLVAAQPLNPFRPLGFKLAKDKFNRRSRV